MGILKKVGIYLISAYLSSCALRYAYNYTTASVKDYAWNSVTGDSRDTTPYISEALFLSQTTIEPEQQAFAKFLAMYGKSYASKDHHD